LFDWRKQNVTIMERTSPRIWKTRTGQLLTKKKSSDKRLMLNASRFHVGKWGRKKIDIPANVTTDRSLLQIGANNYKPLLWLENNVLVEPSETISDPFPALMRPEDMRDADDRNDLATLTAPERSRSEGIMLTVLTGLFGGTLGYIIGQFEPFAKITGNTNVQAPGLIAPLGRVLLAHLGIVI